MKQIVGKIQAFSWDKIVPDVILSRIKESDPNPTIKVFSLAHEGIARPRIIGQGVKALKFLASAVKSVFNNVHLGVQCFDGHNQDNSTDNRNVVGEVIGRTIEKIDGVLHTLVAIHLPNNSDYNVVSMETPKWNIVNGVVDAVDKITGIALGFSGKDQPAFSGAKELGVVQCFEIEHEKNQLDDAREKNNTSNMTLEEIKTAIRNGGFNPSQVFDSKTLIGKVENKDGKLLFSDDADQSIAKIINGKLQESRIVSNSDYDNLIAKQKELEAIKPEWQGIVKDRNKQILIKKIDEAAKDRNLNSELVKFAKNDNVLNRFDGNVETDLDKYIQDAFSFGQSVGIGVEPKADENQEQKLEAI